jgi:hypothetical protein
MEGGMHFTEPLPSNDVRDTETEGGIYEVAVGMGSGVMMYIPNFIKLGSGIQNLMMGGRFTDTQTAWRSHKPNSVFFKKNKGK